MPTAISCFGDSTSFGTGASNPATESYPAVLAGLTGRVVYNFGVPSESSAQILARVLADVTHTATDIVVLWMGHNDNPRTTVVPNVAAAVAHLTTPWWLVLSVLNRTPYEGAPGAEHDAVIAMNNQLAAAYGTRYVDIRGNLVHRSDPATVQGHADHLADLPAFAVDSIHRSAAGYAVIAQHVALVIAQKGW